MTAHPPVPTPTPDPLAELNRAGVSERAWLLYKLRAALDSKVIKGALAPMFVQEAIAQIEADERAHAALVEACRAALNLASAAGFALAQFNAVDDPPPATITAELAIREATELLRAALQKAGAAE